MKAIKRIVGYVLALSVLANLQAQDQKAVSATYISAKDPDLPGLPFNLCPECPITEVSPGVFVVDDTLIPDTQAEVVSRKLRQAAAERGKQLQSDPLAAKAV